MTVVAAAAAGDIPLSSAGRMWTPRPWRAECRRTDVQRVGRFAHERALRKAEVTLSPGAHHVVSVLASYGDENGSNIFPSQETLARVCRRSVRHVRAKLRELTELGLVRRLSHGGGRPTCRGDRKRRVTPARYELTLPASVTNDTTKDRVDGNGAGRRRGGARRGGVVGEGLHEQAASIAVAGGGEELLGGHRPGFDEQSHGQASCVPDLTESGTPWVVLDRHMPEAPDVPLICVDNRGGAVTVTEHLLNHGRRRIACIAGPEDIRAAADRVAGWRDALDAAGITADEAPLRHGPFGRRAAYDAARALLEDEGIEAVFAASDDDHHGLSTPGSLSYLGRYGA